MSGSDFLTGLVVPRKILHHQGGFQDGHKPRTGDMKHLRFSMYIKWIFKNFESLLTF